MKKKLIFFKIKKYYKSYLIILANALNNYHKEIYSVRFWEILIGPWLFEFLTIFFYQWEDLQKNNLICSQVTKKKILNECVRLTSYDIKDFMQSAGEDSWNSAFRSLIYFLWRGHYSPEFILSLRKKDFLKLQSNQRYNTAASFLCKISKYILKYVWQKKIFIISSRVSFKKHCHLCLHMGTLPYFFKSRSIPIFKNSIMPLKLCTNEKSAIRKVFTKIISVCLPTVYLEDFKSLQKYAIEKYWPKTVDAIYTCNNHIHDDLFKVWAAGQSENDVPIIIGQHGSGPDYLFSLQADHEKKIADYLIGPIYEKKYQKKVLSKLANYKLYKSCRISKNVLIVLYNTTKCCFSLQSAPISTEFIDYLENVMLFYSELPQQIKDNVIIRQYPGTDYWNVKKLWLTRFPDTNFSNKKSLESDVKRSNVVISTYLASSYSDLIGSNVPSICFWNPKIFQVTRSANKYILGLQKAKIYHNNPKSAAHHLTKNMPNIETWWNSPIVQKYRRQFVFKYANNINYASEISSVLLKN